MPKCVLITGGAGFIGSHLADELLMAGYHVRILDNLTEQVHGSVAKRPEYLDPDAEFLYGDIRNPQTVRNALEGVSAVFHLAGAVGVAQSMYQVAHYTDINNLGTAVLLEELVEHPVEKLILASSMSIYGEGQYLDAEGNLCTDATRSIDQLKAGRWQVEDARGNVLIPLPTPERKSPAFASVYALSKYDQERMCLMIGHTYGFPVVVLRLFNTYGPLQALPHAHRGVLSIFADRYMNDKPPMIYENGEQRRDFVSVHDVVTACRLALQSPQANARVLNIGSGRSYTINEIADKLARVVGKRHLVPEVTGKYRAGDIRHCFADITLARKLIGYEPQVSLEIGLNELADWLEWQQAMDRVNVDW
jgi:dTDP-L-rhamnose 4-epimerase